MGWDFKHFLASLPLLLSLAGGPLALVARVPAEAGRPLLRSFGPRDTGGDSQNWAMVQDHRGLLYVANNFGVLEYDGARWRTIHTRDNTTPRSLALDAQGRVFVGARNEFGYLAPDDLGRMRYIPLDNRLAPAERNFGNIWTITASPSGVFFVAEKRLFRWDGASLQAWKAPTTFFMGYGVRNRFLVLDKGMGLLEPDGDTLRLIPGGTHFAGQKPRFLVPWNDQGKEILLWGSRSDGLMAFDGEAFRKLPTPADRYLIENILYAGIRLRDGSLALSTIQGGAVILDPHLDRMRLLNKEDGVTNETAYCLVEDPRSGLWLGGSKGIEVLSWPPRLSRFEEQEGLSGAALAIHRHDDSLFVSTNRGLFRLLPEVAATGRRRFSPVVGIKGQCWDMLSLGPSLLVANYDGIYEVRGSQARKILGSTGHTTCFLPSAMDPNRLFVGTVSGLFILDRRGSSGVWNNLGRVEGIPEGIQSLAMGEGGGLWVGCDAPEVLRVTIAPHASAASAQVERFGAKDGLPEDPWHFTATVGGRLVVYGPSGLSSFEKETRRFRTDPRMVVLQLGSEVPLFRVAEGPRGNLWFACQAQGTSLRRAVLGGDGLYHWDGAPSLECSDAPVYAMHPDPDGTLWFGGVAGLFRHELESRTSSQVPEPVLIRSVLKKGGLPIAWEKDGIAPQIPYADNSLRFEYALPRLGPTSSARYQIQLVGHDTGPSPWTTEIYRDYTNLKAGQYQFRVRGRLSEGDTPTEAVYSFQILRPWFRTWWAYGLYALGATLVIGAAHRMRVRLLKKRNEELETRVLEATETLTEQAAKLAWANQELRDLNEQKNHFLGIVSHDLKSPLNGIVMAAETLKTTQDAGLVSQTAQSIETEGLAMGALIDRFLSVTALESGKIKTHPVNLDIRRALQEACARHQARAAAKGIPLAVLSSDDPLWAEADPLLLGEVLDNLISNALKFSRAGQPVNLRAERKGNQTCLIVEDHGPGLRPEDHRKLFTRFARLSAKPTGGENSVGLGLSIARQLVEAMGGQISADEALSKGAVFRVELPAGEIINRICRINRIGSGE